MAFLGIALIRLLQVLEVLILIRAFISWLPIPRDNQLVRLLYQITEPILAPIRGAMERSSFGRNMMIDISPLIALLVIYLISGIIAKLLSVGVFGF